MRYWKLFLPTLLVTLMVAGFSLPTIAQPIPEPPPPKISLKPSTLTVTPCSSFRVDVWITDIPDEWMMTGFTLKIEWDPEYMEWVDAIIPDEWYDGRGWNFYSGLLETNSYYWGAEARTSNDYWTSNAPWLTVEFHCLREGTSTIVLKSGPPFTIYLTFGAGIIPKEPDSFTAVVHQRPPSVGGILIATNKLTVLAPYLGLVGLVAAVTSVVVIMRRRKD